MDSSHSLLEPSPATRIHEERHLTFTVAHFRAASRQELDAALHQYVLDFPPGGYGTYVKTAPHYDAGYFQAEVSRYSTCE